MADPRLTCLSATEVYDGFGFGVIAAIDGWTLDSARSLGCEAGFDADRIEDGYRSVRRCP